jgi:hypothetical protein
MTQVNDVRDAHVETTPADGFALAAAEPAGVPHAVDRHGGL